MTGHFQRARLQNRLGVSQLLWEICVAQHIQHLLRLAIFQHQFRKRRCRHAISRIGFDQRGEYALRPMSLPMPQKHPSGGQKKLARFACHDEV